MQLNDVKAPRMIRPERVTCVVGARPNFMKVAPIYSALCARGLQVRLVHTGQHYDAKMSEVFFDDLGMPRPDAFLDVGSASHARQTARVMERFDAELDAHDTDLVLVAGDVNSTLAAALVASKRGISVGHIEAGLRSRDWRMPEEQNRILTDHLSDLLLTPSPDGDDNLAAEGVASWRIYRVGNLMIDSLRTHEARARALPTLQAHGLTPQGFGVVTLHRPSNVDDPVQLAALFGALGEVAQQLPLIFPIHPRTRTRLAEAGIAIPAAVRLVDPLGYLEFLGLMAQCRVMLTDSGGIQEETTALGVPCLTLRDNTERPVTVSEGTNTLLGSDASRIGPAFAEVLSGAGKAGRIPALWDGCAAQRVADIICGGYRTMIDGASEA
jgi:UDP-N-acetylglucosamine 2-epimerase (non-hydrolysing)